MAINFTPRPSQKEVLQYKGGTLGISAVPGSGKTFILSALAAKLLSEGKLEYDQEILIVTLVNSAVENFASRIRQFIESDGLAINIGYRIRTLHGLANDIVRENPSLVGLENGFAIIDERESETIWHEIVRAWIKQHPEFIDDLLLEDLDERKRAGIIERDLPILFQKVGVAFTRTAKDLRRSSNEINIEIGQNASPLLRMGLDLYDAYERALGLRGAVDFDDLIALALHALENSPELLQRLRHRFPYILEDEAQDSSYLQEKILGLLSGGNWVRVGDPNQAVYETFTTAKPDFLIEFNRRAQKTVDLPESGRCQPAIINLANDLIRWVNEEHPDFFCRDALTKPYIQPTPPGDPQPNPPAEPHNLFLVTSSFSSDKELESVARSVASWVEKNPEKTVAVLCTQNRRASELGPLLRARNIEVIEMLSSSNDTRISANKMSIVMEYLDDPTSPARLESLANLYAEMKGEEVTPVDKQEFVALVKKTKYPESFFDKDERILQNEAEVVKQLYLEFKRALGHWTKAIVLPVDTLVITLAQDLTQDPVELALYHKMAQYLRQGNLLNENWGIRESMGELKKIAQNQRKFMGLGRQDSNFNPDLYPGKVVITTMHKAKGLEWDKVYLMSLNNYDFPSLQEGDTYQPEKYYVKGKTNLEAEVVRQLNDLFVEKDEASPTAGATLQARRDFVRERLRLLYVGITRARQELVLTWNTGRNTHQVMAEPFTALAARHTQKTEK